MVLVARAVTMLQPKSDGNTIPLRGIQSEIIPFSY